jgi:hypothetical protein
MPESLTPKADTNGFAQWWPCTDAAEGAHEVSHSPGQPDQIWHTSDQLADAAQATLTTMSDHNDV